MPNRSSAFARVPDSLRLLALLRFGGGPGVAVLVLMEGATAAVPAFTAVASGAFVQAIADNGTGAVAFPAGATVLLVGLLLAARGGEAAARLAGLSVSRRIDGVVRRRLRALALAPVGVAHLEDDGFAGEMARASDLGGSWWGRRRSSGTGAIGQVATGLRLASAVASAAVVARMSVPLAVVVLTVALASRAIIRRQWMHLVNVEDGSVTGQLRSGYWAELATGRAGAKEVRLFGLAPWILSHRRETSLEWMTPVGRERSRVVRRQGGVALVMFAAGLATLLVPVMALASGRIDLELASATLVAAWAVFHSSSIGAPAWDIEYGRGAVAAWRRMEMRARHSREALEEAGTDDGPARILVQDLSFRYPGADRSVFDGLSFELGPGEVLGIAGRNGVGKTTLVKLIAGLYRPDAGRVLVGGAASVGPPDRRRTGIAAVFQDFVRYPLSVRDNVALSVPDRDVDDAMVREALRRAGGDGLLAELDAGLDTLLWAEGAGGVDLSGGQWQRVALARAMYATMMGRRLLVLDEPTANLDINAEATFYDRVVAATEGASIILISHRFPTLRVADRIVLLDDGRVRETGTHDELVAADGEYARLFHLQAARYRDVG